MIYKNKKLYKRRIVMELSKEQHFEVINDKKVGVLRGIYEDKRLSAQWRPTSLGKDKSKEQLHLIQLAVNSVEEKYPTFELMINECNEHHGKEIDCLFDGLNHHVDLFANDTFFDYWIRLIPQKGEYNIYIYVYEK
jgi:hypothetical protein